MCSCAAAALSNLESLGSILDGYFRTSKPFCDHLGWKRLNDEPPFPATFLIHHQRAHSLHCETMIQSMMELSERALRNHENSPSPKQSIGCPRLVPLDAALFDFYEPLVLFEILQRSLGCPISQVPALQNSEKPNPWRMFLDQLSWLCDFKDGDTSSAIAVADTKSGPCYWLSSNFDKSHAGLSHLEDVMEMLSTTAVSHPSAVRQMRNEILQYCLNFSLPKFKKYRELLLRNLAKAGESSIAISGGLERQLLRDVEHIPEITDLSLLSIFAFEYVTTDTVRKIHQKYRDKAPRSGASAWYNICHYIGRLGSWERAVKFVVRFVRDHPGMVKNYHVDYIHAPFPIRPPLADQLTKFEFVVKRMLPKKEERRADEIIALLRRAMAPGFDLDKEFIRKYKSKAFKPRSHAELTLLECFQTQNLFFFNGDAYVASSKPACYCCNLYFQFNGKDVATRQTHGNVWHNWCLPPALMEADKQRFEWGGKMILKQMTRQIQADILELVGSSLPHRARMQDSTTGLWTVPTSGLEFVQPPDSII